MVPLSSLLSETDVFPWAIEVRLAICNIYQSRAQILCVDDQLCLKKQFPGASHPVLRKIIINTCILL